MWNYDWAVGLSPDDALAVTHAVEARVGACNILAVDFPGRRALYDKPWQGMFAPQVTSLPSPLV